MKKKHKFLKWLKQQKHCVICGCSSVDVHHLPSKEHTRRYQDGGNTVPLCRHCHIEVLHYHPKEEKKLLDWFKKVAERYYKEFCSLKNKT